MSFQYALVDTKTNQALQFYGGTPRRVEYKGFRMDSPTVGPLSQYDGDELKDTGYALLPVEITDLQPANKVKSGRSIDVQDDKVVVTIEYRNKSKEEMVAEKRRVALEAWQEDQLMKSTLPECVAYQQEKAR